MGQRPFVSHKPKRFSLWPFTEQDADTTLLDSLPLILTWQYQKNVAFSKQLQDVDLIQSLISWSYLHQKAFPTHIPQMNFFKLPNTFSCSFANQVL